MSGFAGILNLDGAPIDRALLERLTCALAFRGPDCQEVWCDGPVGFGHALLQTSSATPLEKQPAQLDSRLWIIADARIDARADLIRKLKARSRFADSLSPSSPDAELILYAYDAWGEACVEHLLGDFSFAIWDASGKKLFCARDQFGVKPFYYSRVGSCFVFSNTLDCLRMHPAVSDKLNDLAIADFLLFDMNQDPATTSFADILRLPPAHRLVLERGNLSVRRYWEFFSGSAPIRFSRDEEYIECFRELLDAAVGDRLRTPSAAVMMSGGLDSTTVAASARRIFSRNLQHGCLAACTVVFDSLIQNEERRYGTLAAETLDISVQYLVCDHVKIFEGATQAGNRAPEPEHTAWPNVTRALIREISAQKRVVLTGYGGDPALSGRISVHFRQLLGKMQFGRALADAARYFSADGRFSRLYLKKRWGLLAQSKDSTAGYPPWLNEDFETRWKLRDRWRAMQSPAMPAAWVRQEALELIIDPLWTDLFERSDPGSTGVPVEIRHPFFDLRLLGFLLSLPRLPWCCDKELLREAARGILPDSVRLRRKSPLAAEPLLELLKSPESAWVDRFEPVPELEKYVIRSKVPAVFAEKDSWAGWVHLRPLSLNFWLRGVTISG